MNDHLLAPGDYEDTMRAVAAEQDRRHAIAARIDLARQNLDYALHHLDIASRQAGMPRREATVLRDQRQTLTAAVAALDSCRQRLIATLEEAR